MRCGSFLIKITAVKAMKALDSVKLNFWWMLIEKKWINE